MIRKLQDKFSMVVTDSALSNRKLLLSKLESYVNKSFNNDAVSVWAEVR